MASVKSPSPARRRAAVYEEESQLVGIVISVVFGVLGVGATFFCWWFHNHPAAIKQWFKQRTTGPSHPKSTAIEVPPEPAPPRNDRIVAADLIKLGEHIQFLSNCSHKHSQQIETSLERLAVKLEQCGFEATRETLRFAESTTATALKSQMTVISRALYSEASGEQGNYIKLGEWLWYLSDLDLATDESLVRGIRGFLEQLDKCGLETRQSATPLENFKFHFIAPHRLVTEISLQELNEIMQPIRKRLEYETKRLGIDKLRQYFP